MGCDEILQFWFEEIEPSAWWTKDANFDRLIASRFGSVHAQAARCELHHWRGTVSGRLAEIVVLDQFSRNIYRDSPLAFACDPLALALAQEAVSRSLDRDLEPVRRAFLYMPYMHSESLAVHDSARDLFAAPGLEDSLEYEHQHRAIIERFGRYPHRNPILGRESSPDETAYLAQPGAGF